VREPSALARDNRELVLENIEADDAWDELLGQWLDDRGQ
jgi:hypothetical protein